MKISDYLDRDEVACFTAKSDVHAWRLLPGNWLAIALIFYVVTTWTNPITILLAIVFLACILRQQGSLEGERVFAGYGQVVRHAVA